MSTREENLALWAEVQREVAEEHARLQREADERAEKLRAMFEPIRQAWEDVRARDIRTLDHNDASRPLMPSRPGECVLYWRKVGVWSRYYVNPKDGYTRFLVTPRGQFKDRDYRHCADAEELIRLMYRDIAENQAG